MGRHRPRILHIRSSSELLGAERVILELLQHSSDLGVDASLLVLRDPSDPPTKLYAEAISSGFTAVELECKALPTASVLRSLRQLCENNNIDVVHCHGYKEDILTWLSGVKAKKVATNHLWKRTNLKLWVYSLLDAFSLRYFDHVVGVSTQILNDMRALGVPRSRMSLILNGIDIGAISALRPDYGPLYSGIQDSGSARLIASLSSLTPEKGIDVLIDAVNIVRNLPDIGDVPFKVLVIGEGPERDHIEAMINEYRLSSHIQTLGHRADARELLKLVDIFVLPSRNEGLPISLLEAMAAKCAVVATHVGEVQSVINCESQGIIVPPDDAESLARGIATYLANDQMLDDSKRKGYERVEASFSAQEMTRQYTEIYAKVSGTS